MQGAVATLDIVNTAIDVMPRADDQVATARAVLAEVGVGEPTVQRQLRRLSIAVDIGPKALLEAVRRFDAAGPEPDPATAGAPVEVLDIGLRRPTLDDVFLALTGRRVEESEQAEGSDGRDGA